MQPHAKPMDIRAATCPVVFSGNLGLALSHAGNYHQGAGSIQRNKNKAFFGGVFSVNHLPFSVNLQLLKAEAVGESTAELYGYVKIKNGY